MHRQRRLVEAGLPSGTFSTADAALSAGRDVLAIPGSITSIFSAGANRLIAQGAVPIIDGGQLIFAVRYIHLNPEEAGICSFTEYRWSSYREYLEKAEYVEPSKLLELLGGLEQFLCLHAERGEGPYSVTQIEVRNVLFNWSARLVAEDILSLKDVRTLSTVGKKERNSALSDLKEAGLSIRQIERLTDIGRNIIQRAGCASERGL